MILYNSENSICDVRRFCCPLFYHRSVAKYLSYSSEAVMRLDHQILLKSPPPLHCWLDPSLDPSLELRANRYEEWFVGHHTFQNTCNKIKSSRDQASSQVLRFGEENAFLVSNIFVSIIYFSKNVLGITKFGGYKKNLGGIATECSPWLRAWSRLLKETVT